MCKTHAYLYMEDKVIYEILTKGKVNDFGKAENVWFTSDTHFGHAKIIEFCDRPFIDVQEMNEKLVENWNAVVKPDDWVFHLGDIAFGGDDVWETWIPKLNGKICLILGNHDMKNIKEKYLSIFYWVGNQLQIVCDGMHIYLNHYPFATYGGINRDKPIWQLYGHLHTKNGKCGEKPEVMNALHETMYDVGVDNNNYRPISFAEVREILLKQLKEKRGL